MKKVILVAILVAVLLAGIVLVANAKGLVKVTGSMNYPYGPGWGWVQLNVKIDPSTHAVEGFIKYRSYDNEGMPPEFGGWYGIPICGDYKITDNGDPAVSLVVQLSESTYWPNDYFVKFVVVDGGQNASQDWVGLVVFPPEPSQPGCDYEEPLDIEGFSWYGVNGNVMIHD